MRIPAIFTFLLSLMIQATAFSQLDSSGRCRKNEKEISLNLEALQKTGTLIIEFHSDRNKHISKLTNVSPGNPTKSNPGMETGKDMWFPVIDIVPNDGMQAIAVFDQVGDDDLFSWNSNFWPNSKKLQAELSFDTHLEYWENNLYVESETAGLKFFFLRKKFGFNDNRVGFPIEYSIKCLSNNWSGFIKIFSEEKNTKTLHYEFRIDEEVGTPKFNHDLILTRGNLIQNLKETIQNILACQNMNPLSPTYGGLFLFYDLDAKTYRRSDWIWTYGPAIKLLLEAAEIPELSAEFGSENLLEAARLIGEASLRFQILDAEHPAYGLTICRFDPRMMYHEGFSGYASPADAQFLAGWGWMPLYEATGDRRFLDATILQSDQIGEIMKTDSIVEQDFVLKANQWKNWTMDESGFGMIGFSELYKQTGNKKHKEIGKEYIDGLIHVLEDSNGLWYRTWHRNRTDHTDDCWPTGKPKGEPILMKDGQTTRGNGWAMIGLLASHEMMPEGNYYLKKAIRLAENMLKLQLDDGSWSFNLYVPAEICGISEKGTAHWSLLFFQLYEFSHDNRYLEAAQKALHWCIKNQYKGPDLLATGGIVGKTWASGIVYRNYYPMVCTYTMDWFGLALLEQMKLNSDYK